MHEVEGIQTIKQLQKEIATAKEKVKVEPEDMWLFRGQSRKYPKGWELLPAIYRRKTWLPEGGDDALAMEVYSEKQEEKVFGAFIGAVQSDPSLVGRKDGNGLPTEKLDWLALAQHHFLPTRLLDWTEDPLKALWFALWGSHKRPSVWMVPFQNEDEIERRDDGSCWAKPPRDDPGRGTKHIKDPLNVDSGASNRTLVFKPQDCDDRIKRQDGWLALFPDRQKRGQRPPQTPLEGNGRYKDHVVCFRIDPVMRRELQRGLVEKGIGQDKLFPDADGLALQLGLKLQLDMKNAAASDE